MDDPPLRSLSALIHSQAWADPQVLTLLLVAGLLTGPVLAGFDEALLAIGAVRLQALQSAGGKVAALAAHCLQHERLIHIRLATGRVFCSATSTSAACYLALQRGYAAWAVVVFTFAVTLAFALAQGLCGAWLRRWPNTTTLRVYGWMRPLEWLLAPLGWPAFWLSNWVSRRAPRAAVQEPSNMSELEVGHLIERGEQTGEIARDHAKLLRSALEFKDTVAREIMVQRADMVALELSMGREELLRCVRESGHSRYPVYTQNLDHMEGILYAKDLFQALAAAGEQPIDLPRLLRRPVFFCTEEQKIAVLLREMQGRRIHLAVVVDEFGGVSGLLTLEDILEEIVGDIQDEHDEEEATVRLLAPGRFLVDAGVAVDELKEHLGATIRPPSGEYESVGGMMVQLAGRVPQAGESMHVGDFLLTVRQSDERRVRQVEISQKANEPADVDTDARPSGA